MKIIFFGTPDPAAQLLEALIEAKHEIALVVTQPDRPQGRGQKIEPPPVKTVALRHGLPVQQPDKLKGDQVFKALISSLSAEIAVVAAYGKLIPGELLSLPRFGFINVHASLLPKYRGAAPVQWALLNGETETGITIFRLVEQLDAGPIISQEKIPIAPTDNTETLLSKLFERSKDLLIKTLSSIASGQASFQPQDEAAVTYAPVLSKESGEIDWKKSAAEINNRVRALYPWPAAHTFYRGQRLQLLAAEPYAVDLALGDRLPGRILQLLKGEGFLVATGSGDLLVRTVKPAGGKAMKAADFALGHDVKTADILPN
ncbi:MAG: methionyl-tRNA formyltransferase [Candidatus Margulisbacteria bacterium]|jgi:methionyl-tRNA formyltransferase|nr:methionyl-tRNA formyltransferase [Candidatus Margulisiibacteriota bacterium]